MKIGIDAFGCMHGRSGIGSHLLSLLSELPKEKNLQYEIFGPEMDRYTYTSDNEIEYKSIDVPDSLKAERIWHVFNANKFAKKSDYSAVLYTGATRMLPSKFKIPGVALVNDILTCNFKEHDFWTNRRLRKNLAKINAVIAPSQFVKDDMVKHGLKADKIHVVPCGINHSLFYPRESLINDTDILEIKPFAIKRPYIIYASRMQSSTKKHVELIKAFTKFKEKTQLPHRLVIAGSEGACGEEVHKVAFASSAASDIFITGYFPHDSFAQLYRYAEACVFPAVDEGSGLSVLEAMASGLPVACSNEGALPEITGGNALFFDSNNVDEIAAAIEKIVTDVQYKQNLVDAGIQWTKNYSWEETARKTCEILSSVSE